jgi:hypothetical protein
MFISNHEIYVILTLYVDDAIIISNSLLLLQKTKQYLFKEFEMVDMGPLQYFLGIQVQKNTTTMTMHLH